MKYILILTLITPLIVFAQPDRKDVVKFHIRKVEKTATNANERFVQTWYYTSTGYDSVEINGEARKTIKYVFKNGKPVKKTYYDIEGNEGEVHEYEYKPDGSYKITSIDPNYKMKSYEWYTKKDVLIKTQSPDGNTTTFTYDAKGHIISVKSDGRNDGTKINHKYSYNSKGQLIKFIMNMDENSTITTYEYDSKGRAVKENTKGVLYGDNMQTEIINEYNEKGLIKKKTEKYSSGLEKASITTVNEFTYEYY